MKMKEEFREKRSFTENFKRKLTNSHPNILLQLNAINQYRWL